jgi:spore coat protein U-like protein
LRSPAAVAVAVVIAGLLVTAAPAFANSACTISNGASLEFDSRYDPFAGHPSDGRASFTVRCSRPATVALSLLYTHRLTAGAGAVLHYDLFATPDRLSVWGSGSDGAIVTRSFPGGAPTTVYVYARIPPGQKAVPGAFHDSFSVLMGP